MGIAGEDRARRAAARDQQPWLAYRRARNRTRRRSTVTWRCTAGNAVSHHGPALAHGLSGEIRYVLTRKPRNTTKGLAITLALGLLHLGFIRVFEWDTGQRWLLYLGLWISVVMRGSVCINAMSFDAIRVCDTGGARTPGACPPPRPGAGGMGRGCWGSPG